MSDPKALTDAVREEYGIALAEMMNQARTQPCDTPETYEASKAFLGILQDFYKEQKMILEKIQEAGKLIQAKITNYDNRKEIFKPAPTNNESIDDL